MPWELTKEWLPGISNHQERPVSSNSPANPISLQEIFKLGSGIIAEQNGKWRHALNNILIRVDSHYENASAEEVLQSLITDLNDLIARDPD